MTDTMTLEQVRGQLEFLSRNAHITCSRGNFAEWAHAIADAIKAREAVSVPEMTNFTWTPPDVTINVERVGRFKSDDGWIVRVTYRSSDDGRRMTDFYSTRNELAAEHLHAMLAAAPAPAPHVTLELTRKVLENLPVDADGVFLPIGEHHLFKALEAALTPKEPQS